MAPLVSVVMPVFNSQRYLPRAAQSILDQTYRDFEFLMLDDGSVDSSGDIMRRIASSDSRVKAYSGPNRGVSGARNHLIAIASGAYVAMMDDDDIALPERLAKEVAFLEAHPRYIAVGSKALYIDEAGMPICVHGSDGDVTDTIIPPVSPILPSSQLIRKWAFDKLGGYRSEYDYAEDFDLLLRMAEIGPIACLPEVLVHYRCHPASGSVARRAEQLRSGEKAKMEAARRRNVPYDPPSSESLYVESRGDLHLKWAWWALNAGNIATARKHALCALMRNPSGRGNLRAIYCAMRGR